MGYFPEDSLYPQILHRKSLDHPISLQTPLLSFTRYPTRGKLAFPHRYHAGFNLDFYCPKAVNFMTESWIKISVALMWTSFRRRERRVKASKENGGDEIANIPLDGRALRQQ